MAGSKEIVNPTGAYGYTDQNQKQDSLQFEMVASAAVPAKTVVGVGTDYKIATAATNGTASLALGVSVDAIASGASGLVVVYGPVSGVPANGAIAAGDLVKRSVTTAGAVATTATPAAGEVLGVAVAASASNVVDIWVFPAKVTT